MVILGVTGAHWVCAVWYQMLPLPEKTVIWKSPNEKGREKSQGTLEHFWFRYVWNRENDETEDYQWTCINDGKYLSNVY